MPILGQRIEMTSTIASSLITEQHRQIAEALAAIHGKVRLARESNGIHAYMASPACLETNGRIELNKMHLAVNLDKYLRGDELCAQCMKTGKPYTVSKLLEMKPLSERGISNVKAEVMERDTNVEFVEDDGRGNIIPKHPGKVIPVTALDPEHPCSVYLKYRRLDPSKLYEQFRASYCEEERGDLYWKPTAEGFKATPQGRIIFFIDQNTVQVGWQGRIMEMERRHAKYYWHPYTKAWIVTHQRQDRGQPWIPSPGFETWDPVKYLLSYGAKRNSCVMGLDAAILFNRGRQDRYCFMVEGPTDAARLGIPGIAIMGKYFSDNQAKLVAEHFDHVLFVGDNDESGIYCRQKVSEKLLEYPNTKLHFCDVPSEFKDVDLMMDEAAQAFKQQCLRNANLT